MIGCSEGGTSIEDLAEQFPDKIVKIPVDVRQGLTDAQVSGSREAAVGGCLVECSADARQRESSLDACPRERGPMTQA